MTTILIIEDETAIRELISELLSIEDFNVVEAMNGKEGVAIAQSVFIDLIICDVMMPELDGYGVLAALQENPKTATIPFIFLTAKGTKQDIRYGMNLGADDYLIKPFTNDELLDAINVRLKKQGIVYQQYLNKLDQTKEQLNHFFNHDPLTNLPNQLSLRDSFEKIIVAHEANPTPSLLLTGEPNPTFALIILSFERFSRVNDYLGYEGGNYVLKEAAERIRQVVGSQGIINRLNSNEFVILFNPLSPENSLGSTRSLQEHITPFAKNLLQAFLDPFIIEAQEIVCPIILGIAFYATHGKTLEQLLQCAIKAKESIKHQGGNLYQVYHPSLVKTSPHNALSIERDLRHALENDEFVVYYQPQINAKTRQIVGAEALIRWQHPQEGRIPPYVFIPVAEESGLIQDIGEWVLHKACEQLKHWTQLGLPSIRVAINLSARQFKQANLAHWLSQLLKAQAIEPGQIELELTESIVVDNITCSIEQLTQLKNLGVHVAMDDFGTGYSSLSYLQQFPFDILKIDQCFVRNIHQNAKNAAITKAIIEMAHQLNLRVVAEGVETIEELNFVKDNNCDEIQGYFFSPPIPAEALTQLLQTPDPFVF
ncbi:MAG: EAL domain-containing protein [Snowella sp.]|nr:EAL domain-containing protein [Snowella sp.]